MPFDSMTIAWLVSVLLSLAIHEYAHAALADSAGDPTPRIYGRVTLNPLKHLDPIGTLFIVVMAFAGIGFGWGKPVPMDPRKMRNPKWDHFWAVLGGPLSNLILAIFAAIVIRILITVGMTDTTMLNFILIFMLTNVGLFIFNLLPFGPLDGMWITSTFLPERLRVNWLRFNLGPGQFLFLLLIIPIGGQSVIGYIMGPARDFLTRLLL